MPFIVAAVLTMSAMFIASLLTAILNPASIQKDERLISLIIAVVGIISIYLAFQFGTDGTEAGASFGCVTQLAVTLLRQK